MYSGHGNQGGFVNIGWQEKRALGGAEEAFDRTYQRSETFVIGRVRGYEVKFQLRFGASWSVQVVTNPFPFAMYIREGNYEWQQHRFVCHDPGFDQRYTVDAAPEPIANATLTDALRHRIISLCPSQLKLTPGKIELTKDYACYYAEVGDIREAICLAVTVAEQAHRAAQDAEKQALRQSISRGQNPYRDNFDSLIAGTQKLEDQRLIQTVMQRNKYHWLRKQFREPEFFVFSVVGLLYMFGVIANILF